MEKNQIPTAPLLEIIFDGRNKDYGAYELRTQYNKRLTIALVSTTSLALLVILSSFIFSDSSDHVTKLIEDPVVKIAKVDLDKEDPVIIPPKPEMPRPIDMTRYTPPIIVPDKDVKKEEIPPEVSELAETKISTINQEGEPPVDVVAPPFTGGGIVDAPKQDEEDKVYITVQKEAEFPGGNSAWAKFVSREVNRNIDELQEDGKSGTVMVYFIVDKEGVVSDVKILSCNEAGVSNCLGPDSKLGEIARNAIRKGPKWVPALQNGRNVKAYRRQQVTFRLEEE